MTQVPFINARTGGPGAFWDAKRTAALPGHACDCHVHLFGAPQRYPLDPARAYTPGLAELADAQTLMHMLGVERLVLVQPSAYGFDNACLLDGLAAIGACARGIAVVQTDVGDAELADLHAAGVRGLRINYGGPGEKSSGRSLARDLEAYTARLAGAGWLMQVHAPSEALLAASDSLLRVPGPLVIDHFANIPAAALPAHPACRLVESLLAETQTYLKLSATYRVAHSESELNVLRRWVEKLTAYWPERLLWGSDWPHTPPHGRHIDSRQSVGFRQVDANADLSRLLSWVPHQGIQESVLVRNPETLYDFSSIPAAK